MMILFVLLENVQETRIWVLQVLPKVTKVTGKNMLERDQSLVFLERSLSGVERGFLFIS